MHPKEAVVYALCYLLSALFSYFFQHANVVHFVVIVVAVGSTVGEVYQGQLRLKKSNVIWGCFLAALCLSALICKKKNERIFLKFICTNIQHTKQSRSHLFFYLSNFIPSVYCLTGSHLEGSSSLIFICHSQDVL